MLTSHQVTHLILDDYLRDIFYMQSTTGNMLVYKTSLLVPSHRTSGTMKGKKGKERVLEENITLLLKKSIELLYWWLMGCEQLMIM
jgi:hypothetical protein